MRQGGEQKGTAIENENHCLPAATGQWTAKRKNKNEKFQTIGSDQMVKSLEESSLAISAHYWKEDDRVRLDASGKLSCHFGPPMERRAGTAPPLRQQDIGAARCPNLSLECSLLFGQVNTRAYIVICTSLSFFLT